MKKEAEKIIFLNLLEQEIKQVENDVDVFWYILTIFLIKNQYDKKRK